jgi:hypothetical protein
MHNVVSRPFRPASDTCCERCVFGSGEHATWCTAWEQWLQALIDRLAHQTCN